MTVLTGCVFSAPRLSIRDSRLVGDELRLTVETSVSHDTLTSHSSTVSDVVSYCLLVDLKSTAPLPSRSRVIGPLYRNPAKRSDMAYDGVDFTEQDQQALAAPPRIFFDDLDEMVCRRAVGARDDLARLDFASQPPRWQAEGTASRPSLSTWYIHGFDLNPDAGKILRQVEIYKEPSGSVLNLFALTGTEQPSQ